MNVDLILGANQDIMAYNLYAYCSNNPVNKIDPTGKGYSIGGSVSYRDTVESDGDGACFFAGAHLFWGFHAKICVK